MTYKEYEVNVQIFKTINVVIHDSNLLELGDAIFEESQHMCDGYDSSKDNFEVLEYQIINTYNTPVKFTKTGQYGCGSFDEDDVYTIEEFKEYVKSGAFIDYDGFGYPVKNKMADKSNMIQPSTVNNIPNDATHIVWYNR